MDDIRQAYTDYCGGLIEKNVIDQLLGKCTVQVSKRGMIRYAQFIQILTKKLQDQQKQRVKKAFNLYDERRVTNRYKAAHVKPSLMYKTEVKKMVGAITKVNNNQFENMMVEHDKDQDEYLTIDEVMSLVT